MTNPPGAANYGAAAITDNLASLTDAERLAYYNAVCESIGLNPLSRPFGYILLNGKLKLYATRDAADQLRKLYSVSITAMQRETVEGVHVVTAQAKTPDGRTDEEIGAVTITGLKGDALANALMKAVTKAKRRVTLSICGLGWLDETEIEAIRDSRPVEVNHDTGEIIEPARPSSGMRPLAEVIPAVMPRQSPPPPPVKRTVQPASAEAATEPEDDAEALWVAPPDVIPHLREQIQLVASGKSAIPEYGGEDDELARSAQSRVTAFANGKSGRVVEAIIGRPLPRWSALTRPESVVLTWWFRDGNREQAAASVASIITYLGQP